jgi:hypothetical protein
LDLLGLSWYTFAYLYISGVKPSSSQFFTVYHWFLAVSLFAKDGIRALLLCRVCVGKFYHTQGREPTAIDKYTAGESDSTLGDRAKSVNTYREIVVYNEDQAVPVGKEICGCGGV